MSLDPKQVAQMVQDYTAAWCSGSPEQVASHYAEDGQIIINRGEPWVGRSGLAAMAGGFFSEFPGLVLICEFVRTSGHHALFCWRLEGVHSGTNNFVRVSGWEEWELNDDLQVVTSLGWYDAADYQRQVDG